MAKPGLSPGNLASDSKLLAVLFSALSVLQPLAPIKGNDAAGLQTRFPVSGFMLLSPPTSLFFPPHSSGSGICPPGIRSTLPLMPHRACCATGAQGANSKCFVAFYRLCLHLISAPPHHSRTHTHTHTHCLRGAFGQDVSSVLLSCQPRPRPCLAAVAQGCLEGGT